MFQTSNRLPAIATALLAGALSSNAAIIATEYFNGYGASATYTGGLSGGTGWTSNWSPSDASYEPGSSLSYTATGYDNSANLSGASDGAATGTGNVTTDPTTAYRTFDDGDASTIWISSLISMDGSDRAVLWIDATSSTPAHFIGVLDGQIVMRYNDGSSNTIGTVGAWGNNTNPNGNATFTSGTALLLAKVEVANGGNDTFSFWFNPDLSGGEAGLGTATISAPAGADLFGDEIGGIGMLIVGDEGGNEYIDALRVGTTFADVVPEPSMALLGGLGLLALLRRRRSS